MASQGHLEPQNVQTVLSLWTEAAGAVESVSDSGFESPPAATELDDPLQLSQKRITYN